MDGIKVLMVNCGSSVFPKLKPFFETYLAGKTRAQQGNTKTKISQYEVKTTDHTHLNQLETEGSIDDYLTKFNFLVVSADPKNLPYRVKTKKANEDVRGAVSVLQRAIDKEMYGCGPCMQYLAWILDNENGKSQKLAEKAQWGNETKIKKTIDWNIAVKGMEDISITPYNTWAVPYIDKKVNMGGKRGLVIAVNKSAIKSKQGESIVPIQIMKANNFYATQFDPSVGSATAEQQKIYFNIIDNAMKKLSQR